MLDDKKIPATIRHQLKDQYQQVQQLIKKLEQDQIHLVAFGKVSTGKSSLLNSLIGQNHFSVSPLHGETRTTKHQDWQQYSDQSVVVIDTPGTDESEGETREKMAQDAANQADIILFVLDGDISQSQMKQLKQIKKPNKPIILVLNKADLYTDQEIGQLTNSITEKCQGLMDYFVTSSADPNPQIIISRDAEGNESKTRIRPEADVSQIKQIIWKILADEGKTLTALNASLFAGQVSENVAKKITEVRAHAANKIVRTYCIAKGIGVAFNPIPVADLLLAAGLDVTMIRKLSSLYGLPLSNSDASKLTATIMAQLAVLMAAVWGVNLLSSALKTISAGLSTTITASAQGSLAYYATYLVGKIAERYFIQGNSWGEDGPKTVAKEILDSLDRDSILLDAREQIIKSMKT
ncbi:MAG: GTP-binding protein [Proteobacteria bacterium]|nr:GTP-binding protein [Pseudomonadota bacterium]